MIPKFLVGDNSEMEDSIFIIHTQSPKFILDIDSENIHWLENFDKINLNFKGENLKEYTKDLIDQAKKFYDKELEYYKKYD